MMDLKQKFFEKACEAFFYSNYVRSIGIKYTAKELGVSKYKVRKAVKELVSEGLLEVDITPGFWTEEGHIPPRYGYIVSSKGRQTEEFKKEEEKDLEYMKSLPF